MDEYVFVSQENGEYIAISLAEIEPDLRFPVDVNKRVEINCKMCSYILCS